MSQALVTRTTQPLDEFERAARVVIASKGSPRTRAAYSAELDRWLGFCAGYRIRPASAEVPAVVVYRAALLAEGLSEASVRLAMAAMSSVYKQLLRDEEASMNPFHPAWVAWPRASGAGTQLVSDSVAQMMIDHAQERSLVRDAAILRLLYDTGLRRQSVAGLMRKNISTDASFEADVVVKGNKKVHVWGTPDTSEAVTTWMDEAPPSPFVFPGRSGGHVHVSLLNKIIRKHGSAVGAPDVHPHCFRAAFITTGLDVAKPHEVQGAAHHAAFATTLGYDRGRRGAGVAEAVAAERLRRRGSK